MACSIRYIWGNENYKPCSFSYKALTENYPYDGFARKQACKHEKGAV